MLKLVGGANISRIEALPKEFERQPLASLNIQFKCLYSLKEIISQTDLYLVKLSSKTFVFEDKMTKY